MAQRDHQAQNVYGFPGSEVPTHSDFSGGMLRDPPAYAAPDNALYDAADLLCDIPPKIRKRGGTTSPAAGNGTATVENLIGFSSGASDGVTGVFGSLGKSGLSIRNFSTSTGATTQLVTDGSSNTVACKPFQYGNLMVFPFTPTGSTANDRNAIYYCGGSTSTAAFTPTAATVTANDNRVTGIAATNVVAAMLGSVIWLKDAANTHMYAGRITEVTSSSAVRVDPTPTVGFTANNGIVGSPAWSSVNAAALAVDPYVLSGRYGCSFQGRIVLGYTTKTQGVASGDLVKGIERSPNRLIWSQLPTEPIPTAGLSGYTLDGLACLYPQIFPQFNFLDVPGLGGMTGLAAVGDGQLIIFGPRATFRVSGFLVTETVENPSFSFSVDQISANIGCIASRSIQYVRGGLVFLGADNLYEYNGTRLEPLFTGRNARYLQNRLRAGDNCLGSFYFPARNTYFLSMSGTDGGLLVNLDTWATTRQTNLQLFDSCVDPVDQTKLWAARWWDTTSAAPTMTKGQLLGLESLWLPTSANKTDADGTAVLPTLQKGIVGGSRRIDTIRIPTDLTVGYSLRGSGSPTAAVTVDTTLDPADASYVAAATLASTGSDSTTMQFPVGPLVAENRALDVKVTVGAACDSFELLSLTAPFHDLNQGFSTS